MCTTWDPPPKPIETFVFMDLEATGLPPSQPKIAEMCLFAVNRHAFENPQYSNFSLRSVPLFPRLVDKLCICINPDKAFTPEARLITGLNNEAFSENKKQSFNIHIIHMITAFFNRQHSPVCLVAHSGCSYDFPLLKAELSAIGISALDEIYCADTFKALKALDKENNRLHQFTYQKFGSKKSYKLDDLYFKFYKEYPLNSHSAEGDVITLIRVFQQHARDLMHWMDSNARQFNTIRTMYKGSERRASISRAPWSLQHPSFLQVGPCQPRLATMYSFPAGDDRASLKQNTAEQGYDQFRPLNNTDIPDEIKNMLLFLLGLAIITWIVLNPV
ncbi:three-prime repair exonuclease 1-like [Sphaerodactylus townsendi]|uniref:three-prime repair exonuclease 1-like n=1 Tax=Sphaerodactylus townsendi TaxID=933632 RepID=UPI0020273598|nr:three-prime repair exonuclease 1-like [Sphaerodactylus townsendi]XP_048345596.1 three-prime repair exonuclease 1-like [Sphaerodactylus townsendi]